MEGALMPDANERTQPSARRGAPPPDIANLARVEDRISFLYFEHSKINSADNAITVRNDEGIIYIPSATLSVLLLGPGTDITHDAMKLIGESGGSVVWVGERGIRMYAFGQPLTHSSTLLQQQAKLVSNTRTRLAVARKMYSMRFASEDVSKLTMAQLRGREGARIKRVYRHWSQETGVAWDQRTYNPVDFDDATEINKALSAAHVCLYALAYSAIVALGCSPGLGFVHTGHEKSFVYDIADLYKAEVSIPVAFRTVAEHPLDVGVETRRNMRDAIYDLSILSRMVRDIKGLLLPDGATRKISSIDVSSNHLGLWDDKFGEVPAGKSYAGDLGDDSR